MEKKHRNLITGNFLLLVKKLNVDIMILHFQQNGLLNERRKERIKSGRTRYDVAENFLEELPRLGPKSFLLFDKVLCAFQPNLHAEIHGKFLPEEKCFQDALKILANTCRSEQPKFEAIVFVPRSNITQGLDFITHCEKWNKSTKLLLLFTECLMDEEICSQITNVMEKGIKIIALVSEQLKTENESIMKICYFSIKARQNSNIIAVDMDKISRPHFLLEHLSNVNWNNACLEEGLDRKILISFLQI